MYFPSHDFLLITCNLRTTRGRPDLLRSLTPPVPKNNLTVWYTKTRVLFNGFSNSKIRVQIMKELRFSISYSFNFRYFSYKSVMKKAASSYNMINLIGGVKFLRPVPSTITRNLGRLAKITVYEITHVFGFILLHWVLTNLSSNTIMLQFLVEFLKSHLFLHPLNYLINQIFFLLS